MAEAEPSAQRGRDRPSRGSFGPLVLLGIASAALAALASAKVWVAHDLTLGGRPVVAEPGTSDIGSLPLAGALGLLLLAAWGVVLVTRGRVRLAVGVIGALVSLGLLGTVLVGWFALPGEVRAGFATQTSGGYRLTLHRTGWFWVAGAAAVLSTAVTALSVLRMPAWPEMGRRYDAPADSGAAVVPAADDPDADNLALWKAIDAGADPTDPHRSAPPD